MRQMVLCVQKKISRTPQPGISGLRLLLSFLLLLGPSSTLNAQLYPEFIQHLTTANGLSQNMIFTIFQDNRGFMWFATKDGLNRYDGYGFNHYRNDPSNTKTISPGYVGVIHQCESGLMWLRMSTGAIDVFDPSTGVFTHLTHPLLIQQNAPASPIIEDRNGVHWVGGTGLTSIQGVRTAADAPSAVITHFPFGSRSETIRSVYEDNSGTLWIARSIEAAEPGERGGLFSFDRTNGRYTPYFPLDDETLLEATSPVGRLLSERTVALWFARERTLMYFDRAQNKLQKLELNVPPSPDTQRRVYFVHSNTQGYYLFQHGYGALRFDPLSSQYSYVAGTSLAESDAPTVLAPYVSRDGTVWFGTAGFGLLKYDAAVARFGFFTRDRWFKACTDALQYLKQTLGDRLHGTLESPGDIRESRIFRDSKGIFWVRQYRKNYPSLIRLDPATGNETRVTTAKPVALSDPETLVLEDQQGTVWVRSLWGVSRYNERIGALESYTITGDSLVPFDAIPHYRPDVTLVGNIVADNDGTFWFGSIERGLINFNLKDMSLRFYPNVPSDTLSLSSNHVISILPDPAEPDRYLWVGTDGGGLNKFDKKTARCIRITEQDGLPNNVVYGILADKQHNLWMSTNRGICKFNPRAKAFRVYTRQDGLQDDEFNRYEYWQAPDGKMFFGGTKGINAFYPEDIVDNPYIPRVVFTGLQLSDRPVTFRDPDSPLTQPIEETQDLVLAYSERVIRLEFAALDFGNPEKNQYSHVLEGFEEEWTQPTTRRAVTYTNLDPGEYVLRVRGSNSDDVWNMEGASLRLVITPPWWRTDWAYLGYVLAILSILYSIRRYELNRQHLKHEAELGQIEAEKLRDVDQMKSRFFANISHEFRTPLTLILGPIEKWKAKADEHSPHIHVGDQETQTTPTPAGFQPLPFERAIELRKDMSMAGHNARRLLQLINQLLDLSKLEAKSMKLQACPGNVVSFVRGVVSSFESSAGRRGITLTVEAETDEIEMYFDRDKMEKILVNLLSNAFKSITEGSTVSVTLTPSSGHPSPTGRGDRGVVDITVSDTGIGIPADQIDKIFDRFYQVDSSHTREQEGTGIGLALTKELVELHHGRIIVRSEVGTGTEFIVRLPLGTEHLNPDEIIAAKEHGEEQFSTAYAGAIHESPIRDHSAERSITESLPIVLVVEDNADVRAYIKEYLVPEYHVLEAKDGLEGVEKAKETIPDLILSDVMMPKMDGNELCRTLKLDEKTSHIPIILLTAKAGTESRIEGLETGADDYLVKPFDAKELLVRVRNLIALRRKLRERYGKTLMTVRPDQAHVKSVDTVFLDKVKAVLEQNISREDFSVEELATDVAMSRAQLHRKLVALTNTSPRDVIRSFRLQRAKDMLEHQAGTVAEIAFAVGFSSAAYFTKCFHEEFGSLPSEMRKA